MSNKNLKKIKNNPFTFYYKKREQKVNQLRQIILFEPPYQDIKRKFPC